MSYLGRYSLAITTQRDPDYEQLPRFHDDNRIVLNGTFLVKKRFHQVLLTFLDELCGKVAAYHHGRTRRASR
jgi:hypothetical protein